MKLPGPKAISAFLALSLIFAAGCIALIARIAYLIKAL